MEAYLQEQLNKRPAFISISSFFSYYYNKWEISYQYLTSINKKDGKIHAKTTKSVWFKIYYNEKNFATEQRNRNKLN